MTAAQRCFYRALLRQNRVRPDKLASVVVRIVTRMQSHGARLVSDADKIRAVANQFPGVADDDLLAGYRAWLAADDAPGDVRGSILSVTRGEIERRGLTVPADEA